MKWISLSEQEPKKNTVYLIFDENNKMIYSAIYRGDWLNCGNCDDYTPHNDVKWYMPLPEPEPPKE